MGRPLASRAWCTSAVLSSGHNRWSKIRHKKGAADEQRGQLFSRITNDLHRALLPPHSPDPASNPRLALALQRAREAGVPRSNVDAAFKRARERAEGGGGGWTSVVYEAIEAGGRVGLMVECQTENTNRTVSRVKEELRKHGARLSPSSYLFERRGRVLVQLAPPPSSTTAGPTPFLGTAGASFERFFDAVLEAGGEDVVLRAERPGEDAAADDDATAAGPTYEVVTAPSDVGAVSEALAQHGYDITAADIAWVPTVPLVLSDEAAAAAGKMDTGEQLDDASAERTAELMNALEAVPEVVRVWTNVQGLGP